MPDELALITAVLALPDGQLEQIAALLRAAQASCSDLLAYIAKRGLVNEAETYARAAAFSGFAFAPRVPDCVTPASDHIRHIDSLGAINSFRGVLLDREVIFVAPTGAQLLSLRSYRQSNPDIARRVCIVPPRALQEALRRHHSIALFEQARQRLFRKWPFSSSHIELTLFWRVSFVLMLAVTVGATLITPFGVQPFLLPLLILLLLAPSCIRIAAIAEAWSHGDTVDLPAGGDLTADADLPVYTILVPLRDEANMVPQLAHSLRALDYPALCIKRTKGAVG